MQSALSLELEPRPDVVLRPYQSQAIASICRDWRDGHRNVYLEQATGTGKTTVFSWIATRAKGRVLLLAHRDLLIRQIRDRLLAMGAPDVGVEQADQCSSGERLVVGSVDSLSSERRAGKFDRHAFSAVIVDECHRVQSPTYLAVLEAFDAMPGGQTMTLGVTATPDRLDERAIMEVFPRLSYRYEVLQGIDDGYLCPVVVEHLHLDISLEAEGDEEQVARILESAKAIEGVAKSVLDKAGDRPTAIFTTSVDNAKAIAAMLNHLRPDCAVAVDGSITGQRRDLLLRQFTSGLRQFVVNVDVLGEGWDHPPISCVVLARPTKSRAKMCQQIGRGLRPFPGKDHCLVLDLVGNLDHMGLCTPIDALAGARYGDVAAKLAREMQAEHEAGEQDRDADEEPKPVHEYLHAAKEELERRKRTQVRAVSRRGDAFSSGDGPDDRRGRPQQASEKQRKICAWLLCPEKPWLAKRAAAQLSTREASEMISKAQASRPKGACSLGQQALLAKFGVHDVLPKKEASELIDRIAANGWRLPVSPL